MKERQTKCICCEEWFPYEHMRILCPHCLNKGTELMKKAADTAKKLLAFRAALQADIGTIKDSAPANLGYYRNGLEDATLIFDRIFK